MVIHPKVLNNVCMNAHPKGCAREVQRQIDYVRRRGGLDGPKKVLVIGGSTGYGLASRVVAAFGAGASTIGVSFEKPPSERRPATAGWYNNAVFDNRAEEAGFYARTLNGDAYSMGIKSEVIDMICADLEGGVDLLVYSLASGGRTDPLTGETFRSALKPIGKSYTAKSLNPMSGEVSQTTIEAATEDEIASTVRVMGGEDWHLWTTSLLDSGVLAEGATTVAYSYIGPELTYPIYREGTIGQAKQHLEATASELREELGKIGGRAFVSVNKAVVSRASAVIPVVPLYISLLYQVMGEQGMHEGCIEQMDRLFRDRLYGGGEMAADPEGRIRLDDLELRQDVQEEIARRWELVNQDNVNDLADVEGYRREFLQLHGFRVPGIDYDEDVDTAEVD
jgi:enoyl-[acyl-carrier protein] reductase / trans-2-enoyl-CoA reductase (NAD+)